MQDNRKIAEIDSSFLGKYEKSIITTICNKIKWLLASVYYVISLKEAASILPLYSCLYNIKQELQHYNVTINDLEEYIRNKPLVETIKSQQNKLEKEKDRLII